MAAKKQSASREPTIENRRARHDYAISDTLECGIRLTGSEVKSVRDGKVSLAEGYVFAVEEPAQLSLHGVHIAEYPPAGKAAQHEPVRTRALLAHKREIKKLARQVQQKGMTLVPLKMYFAKGKAKLLIGLGQGKKQHDQRRSIAERQAKRDISRALSRKMG
jgi:SsrA-binding protein